MGTPNVLFSRRYRAALLDYLLSSGEGGLARAYDLGRAAMNEGLGLLELLRTHQRAVNTVLESTNDAELSLRRLKASEEFLMETLSPFEMTYRGYVALLSDSAPAAEKKLAYRPPRRSE